MFSNQLDIFLKGLPEYYPVLTGIDEIDAVLAGGIPPEHLYTEKKPKEESKLKFKPLSLTEYDTQDKRDNINGAGVHGEGICDWPVKGDLDIS